MQGSGDISNNFNKAVSTIQLFGNDKQVKYINKIVSILAGKTDDADGAKQVNCLLKELRDTLRKELDLPKSNQEINLASPNVSPL
jgi:hypothetical protein